MRQLLFPAAAIALCSCALTRPSAESTSSIELPAVHQDTSVPATEPATTIMDGPIAYASDDSLLGLDPALLLDFSTEDLVPYPPAPRQHAESPPFNGPLPVPAQPARDADPLEIAIWVGTASVNYDLEAPFDATSLSPFVSTLLATELGRSATLSPKGTTDFGSRGVLLDAWLNEHSSRDFLADGVAIFERTSEQGEVDIVFIDFLAHETSEGWEIIELQLTTT